ncbi:STAS domain-containing protein [Aquimarina celericrescens]|uniref:STAS domain-containing protein n=1 Tax=Aquimarina celericrescens TaxID=1964542 RepID=A0ABW5AV75_9FLAO|nr:STAS domain-containing protein [Aquimarina celericrescens]
MALQITNNQGVFEINGNIISENSKSLQSHFEQLLHKTDSVFISVDNVKKIDVSGINVLTKLYKSAMKNNKIFFIIGKENEVVKKAFGKVNYILRSDFL